MKGAVISISHRMLMWASDGHAWLLRFALMQPCSTDQAPGRWSHICLQLWWLYDVNIVETWTGAPQINHTKFHKDKSLFGMKRGLFNNTFYLWEVKLAGGGGLGFVEIRYLTWSLKFQHLGAGAIILKFLSKKSTGSDLSFSKRLRTLMLRLTLCRHKIGFQISTGIT